MKDSAFVILRYMHFVIYRWSLVGNRCKGEWKEVRGTRKKKSTSMGRDRRICRGGSGQLV